MNTFSDIDWITIPKPINYNVMLARMEKKLQEVINGSTLNTIYLLEHEDVYTAGSSYDICSSLQKSDQKLESSLREIVRSRGNPKNVRENTNGSAGAKASFQNDGRSGLKINSIPLIQTSRGGKLTYHGKGQRVIYPIINLAKSSINKDIGLYVRSLEQWIINSLGQLDIKSYTIKGKVGIWINKCGVDAKIASIGIRIKKWVAYHGLAINISSDLSKFNDIIACGIKNIKHTSLEDLGINIKLAEFDDILKQQFNYIGF